MGKETEFMHWVQMEASQMGGRLFRNNVGLYLSLDGMRKVKAGLCKGSSDLIGFFPKEITKNDVGKVYAIFTAIETKAKRGKLSKVQENFIKLVQKNGGIAGEAKNLKEFWGIMNGF